MAEMADDKVQQIKEQGNKHLQMGDFDKAIESYTEAILIDPSNHILYSNRAAAYLKSEKYERALEDAKKCIELQPAWPKGYCRLGAAHAYLNNLPESETAYETALKHDPKSEQIRTDLNNIRRRMGVLTDPFKHPHLWSQLNAHPMTRKFLQDPEYKKTIERLVKDEHPLRDPIVQEDGRIMQTIGVLLGVDMSDPDEEPPYKQEKSEDQETSQQTTNGDKEEKMETESTFDDNQKQALVEKDLGNKAYQNKDFETAHLHYNKAKELDPTNIIFLTNNAAVYFEEGKFDECIKECEEAVQVGRLNQAEYKHIAKAFSRMGNVYFKQQKYKEAITYYQKSLTEFRLSDVAKKCLEAEKLLKEKERLEYINPEKALEEKAKGNELFKKGDFPNALKSYSEAIKRNPDDAKLYSNRAATYQKLAAFDLALKDCVTCIEKDPSFVKGYTRKGGVLFAMKRYSEAQTTYQKALELDPNNKEAKEGLHAIMTSARAPTDPEEIKQRAMADPEVQNILADPGMKIILEQMQEDPKAAQEHLKNPDILKKIQKLMEVGILQMR